MASLAAQRSELETRLAAQRSEFETRLVAQWSELETRGQGLEIHKQELDKLSETLQGWCEQLQEAASKQAVAELELEEDRKSLAKREFLTTNIELQLERQCETLKSLKGSTAKKKAELEERTREVEAAKAALDTRVLDIVLFLCYVTNIVLVEILIKENFNLAVCQLLWLWHAAPRRPGPLADRFSCKDLSTIGAVEDTPDPRMRLGKRPWA